MDTPKKQHLGIDEWKLTQIKNLNENGFSAEEISQQVDVEISIVREVILLTGDKSKEAV
jgi:hypothetical protein